MSAPVECRNASAGSSRVSGLRTRIGFPVLMLSGRFSHWSTLKTVYSRIIARHPSNCIKSKSELNSARGEGAAQNIHFAPRALFSRTFRILPALYPARIPVSSSLLAATMNQKSSLREDPQSVSGVLTGNNPEYSSSLSGSNQNSQSNDVNVRFSRGNGRRLGQPTSVLLIVRSSPIGNLILMKKAPLDIVKDNLGQQVRELRRSLKLSQAQLAARVASHQEFISDVERGRLT